LRPKYLELFQQVQPQIVQVEQMLEVQFLR
jgi:hypothetical protein